MSPRALMACANYWTSPFRVGSHHLARGLVDKGWEVAFISDPISPWHALQGVTPELRERWAIYRAGGLRDVEGRVWAYVPAAAFTPHNQPFLRGDWLHRRWSRLTTPNVVDAARAEGFGAVDLLYLDSVNQAFWLDAIPHRRSMLRIADRMSGFQKWTPAMARLEREIAGRVDLVAYTAQNLRGYVDSLGPRDTLYLPNGVNFAQFAGADRSMPAELAAIPRPVVIYIGAMKEWFDFDLVDAAAARLPQVSFVLIGPDQLARRHLRPRPNLHLLGSRPYAELPAYLHNADVGIIPFNVAGHRELIDSVQPLKLYEYLACGLPVVAVGWEELRQLGGPASLTSTVDEFVGALGQAVSRPGNRELYRDFAKSADWSRRVETLLSRLALDPSPSPTSESGPRADCVPTAAHPPCDGWIRPRSRTDNQ